MFRRNDKLVIVEYSFILCRPIPINIMNIRSFQIIVVFSSLIVSKALIAQTDNSLQSVDSMLNYHVDKTMYHQHMSDSLEDVYTNLKNRSTLSQFGSNENGFRIPTVTLMDTKVRRSGSALSEPFHLIDPMEIVYILGYSEGYYLIQYQNVFGYVNPIYLKISPEIEALKQIGQSQQIAKAEKAIVAYTDSVDSFENQRYEELVDTYGVDTANKITSGIPWIGMSQNLLYRTLGMSNRTTESATNDSKSVFYHYDTCTVLVVNGKVVSITYSR